MSPNDYLLRPVCAGLGDLCRKHGTLLAVDTVCTLGGVPLFADAWGIDAILLGLAEMPQCPARWVVDTILRLQRIMPAWLHKLQLGWSRDQWFLAGCTLHPLRRLCLVMRTHLHPNPIHRKPH